MRTPELKAEGIDRMITRAERQIERYSGRIKALVRKRDSLRRRSAHRMSNRTHDQIRDLARLRTEVREDLNYLRRDRALIEQAVKAAHDFATRETNRLTAGIEFMARQPWDRSSRAVQQMASRRGDTIDLVDATDRVLSVKDRRTGDRRKGIRVSGTTGNLVQRGARGGIMGDRRARHEDEGGRRQPYPHTMAEAMRVVDNVMRPPAFVPSYSGRREKGYRNDRRQS